ncbi:MAG: hypothetical protein EBZ65_05080 [Betaproteobacteria bacterium]|nr:hypothetical protein [Betaproteobacteria bacterium]
MVPGAAPWTDANVLLVIVALTAPALALRRIAGPEAPVTFEVTSCTIVESLAPGASDADLVAACERARIHDTIAALPVRVVPCCACTAGAKAPRQVSIKDPENSSVDFLMGYSLVVISGITPSLRSTLNSPIVGAPACHDARSHDASIIIAYVTILT